MPSHSNTSPVQAILASAESIFAIKGLSGSTTGQIAERAGVPKATLHYHFHTKEQLYRQVLHDIFNQWLDAASSFDQADNPADAIAGYVRTKMELSRRRPKASKIWAQEIISGAPHLKDMLVDEVKPWMDNRVAKIREWIASGQMEAVEPESLLFMIWALTQHYADFEAQIRLLTGQSKLTKDWFEQKTEDVVRLVLRSVGL